MAWSADRPDAVRRLSVAAAAVVLSALASPAERLQILSDAPLPAPLTRPTDLRWETPEALLVGDALQGIFRLAPGAASSPVHLVGGGDEVRARHAATVSLGISPTLLVAAGGFFSLRWYRRDTMAQAGEATVELIDDLDVSGDRLLVLGGRRDDQGKFGGDGAIAWMGSLGANLADLRPVLPSRSGPGIRTMDRCGILGLGALRFRRDGSFVIAPGVDPGVFLYSPAGKLLRTWDTDRLGLARCDVDDRQRQTFLQDFAPAMDWLNRRRVIDETLDLPGGPALVVRSSSGGRVSWDLALLGGDGSITTVRLPFTSSSKWTRLKADASGDRIAFLLSESLTPRDARPTASRLVVARLPTP